jgi:hypothetical protein
MRVINVVTIKEGVVNEIESFGVFEEQLVNDVVKPAEELFVKKAKELGCNTDDEDEVKAILDNGYYESANTNKSVCISWSEI